jgi:hypothetical protein
MEAFIANHVGAHAPAAPIASAPYIPSIDEHPGYAGVFRPSRLTFGLVVAPLEPYAVSPWPALDHHADAVRLVEDTDIAALWLRDVPFYDPSFGNTGQLVDPMVYAGWLAAWRTIFCPSSRNDRP